jgi:hypothetical protein
MRKLLWGGVAMLVIGATSVFIAADYARQHPHSLLARIAGATAAGLVGSPVAVLHHLHASGQDGGEMPDGMVQNPGDPSEIPPPVLVPLDEQHPAQETEEPDDVIRVPQPDGFERVGVDFSGGTPRYYGRAHDGADNGDGPCMMPPVQVDPMPMPEVGPDEGVPQEVKPFDLEAQMNRLRALRDCLERCVPFSGVMPVDPPAVEVIPEMPRAVEELGVFGWMRSLLEGFRAEQLVPGGEEQCEPEEDPGCHWLLRMIGVEHLSLPTVEPMIDPEPMTEEEQGQEEPPMRDPDYHRYHYHGCPYSGCPYHPYSSMPPVYTPPVTPTPAPEGSETQSTPHHKRHGCGSDAGVWGFWQRLFRGPEGCGGQTGVDTMECRPIDLPFDLRRMLPF